MTIPHDSILDPEISFVVRLLQEAGVETFESCQGGEGHAFFEPTVRFRGNRSEGWRALAVVLQVGLPVFHLRRYWTITDGEPDGPSWELTFKGPATPPDQPAPRPEDTVDEDGSRT